MRTRWKCRLLLTVPLIAPLVLRDASGANAQTAIGPGTITTTQTVTAANSPATVVGNTNIVTSGDGIDGPPFNGTGGTLNINTEVAPNVTGRGPISITSGGTGVASIFPSSPATININAGPSGNVTITSGGAALGVSGSVSLTATANGSQLFLYSTGNYGVVAQFGASVNITGASIRSDGFAGVLIGGDLTNQGATGSLTNVSILGTAPYGLVATRTGTVATMSGGNITLTSAGGAGLYSDTNGVTNTTNVTISTMGAGSYGAFAEATIPATPLISPGGGTINITGGSITTQGVGAFGAFAQGQPSVPSTITLNNSTITTSGAGAAGYRADGGSISATNTTTQTSGTAAPGGILSNGGKVSINGGSVTTTGAGSFGFLVEQFSPSPQTPQFLLTNLPPLVTAPTSALPLASEPALPNVLQINNATLNSTADAFSVQGAIANITLNGSSITSNNGVLVNTLSSGTTNLTATASQLTGVIATDSTSTANVTLQGGTTWRMTGNSNLTNLTNNASTIIFSPPTGDPTLLSSYKTLTVNNYTGVGGTIGLNTYLGTDGSPSDRLVINGGTADPSLLRITNSGGPGALTTANGILVVQTTNGGTTAPGAFTLAGEARAGAFDYDLFRGGLNGNDPQEWFLRNSFGSGQGPTEPIGPNPPPEPLPPGVWPIIGPELATYGVVQPIARQLGLTTLGTFHERVGDASADAACLNAAPEDAALVTKAPPVPYSNCRPAIWGRLFGQQIDNHYQAFADPRASGQVVGIQTGVDVWRGSLIPGHSDTAGVYFAYGYGNASVEGLVTNAPATAYILQHTGSLNLNAYSLGGYWTHYGPAGWYIDAVLQGSFYSGNAGTQFASLSTNGTGFISSLEAGYPIPLPWLGPRFVLEPECQMIWQRVSFNEANDGLGPVGLGTNSGASGRLGLRGKWTINDPAGRVWQPYVLANVWRDWAGSATTMFGVDPVPLLERATRLEFAGGFSAKLLRGLSIYAQAGYQFAVSGTDGGTRDGVRGDLGVHYTW